jgi:hypothetical protein
MTHPYLFPPYDGGQAVPHGSQLKKVFIMWLRLWVLSPLGGEGQDKGNEMATILLTPLTLALSPAGRGDLYPSCLGNILSCDWWTCLPSITAGWSETPLA